MWIAIKRTMLKKAIHVKTFLIDKKTSSVSASWTAYVSILVCERTFGRVRTVRLYVVSKTRNVVPDPWLNLQAQNVCIVACVLLCAMRRLVWHWIDVPQETWHHTPVPCRMILYRSSTTQTTISTQTPNYCCHHRLQCLPAYLPNTYIGIATHTLHGYRIIDLTILKHCFFLSIPWAPLLWLCFRPNYLSFSWSKLELRLTTMSLGGSQWSGG